MSSSSPHPTPLLAPYTRIFALEMQQSDLIMAPHNTELHASLLTPSGAKVFKFYFCGAVTEMTNPGGRNPSIRIADPTGGITFFIKAKNQEVLMFLEQITPPIFVSALAHIEKFDRIKKHQNTDQHTNFQCIIDTLTEISRKERDNWIIETANLTMARVETMYQYLADEAPIQKPPEMEKLLVYMDPKRSKNHYQTSVKQLRLLANVAENALEQVKPIVPQDDEESTPIDHTSTILSLVQEHSGPRGVEITTLLTIAQRRHGISEAVLLETIKTLISEDEIYQPSSGSVKVL
ncbi:MAG: hypothetical protein LBV40_03175 [Methanomicrobiales archaeon]|jgi:RPA family protein|nr:hypothetical protein [Methanomicrobiales archaeon]